MTPNLSHVAGLELAKKAMEQQRERYGGVHKASLACLDGLIEIAKSAPAEPDAELVELLRSKFPRIDPCQPVPLDEKAHCCEYTIYVERERLHRIIAAKLASLKGVEE